MASSSSSTNSKWSYDVFISFRGEDTRKNFVDHLYTALVDGGIHTFKDDEKLKKGESVSTELPKAIEESRIAIVVFSKKYADSSWCLDELVKIIDCRNSIGQKVLPVFFDVDPSEVRKQKGSFEEAFCKLQLNGGKDQNQIQRWRDALAEAASISGWSLQDAANGHESKCIKQIVEEIFINMRDSRASSFSKKLIGFESRMWNVRSLLNTSSNEVQMLGIWGMGGSGKTTLARTIFADISHEFEGRCFVANVRETSKSGGLPSLQEQILCDILNQTNKVLYINWSALRLHFPALSLTMKNLKHLSIFGGLESIDSMDLLYHPSLSIFQHVKTLWLEKCGLLRFPSNLSEMPALEYLDLSGNDFTYLPNNLRHYTRLKVLVLVNCVYLKALTELPRRIAVIKMDNCKSLESHGDMLTAKYKWLRLVSFGDCLKLKSQDKSSSSGLAAMLFQTLLQGRAFVNYQFSILVPGTEIPGFVFLQLDVNEDIACLRHLPDWNRRIVGFTVCFSFVYNLTEKVSIYLGDKYSSRYFFISCFDKTLISDHIWMGYISLELLGQQFFGDGYKNQDDLIRGTKDCFLEVSASNLERRIKKVGIHVVYGDSIEELMIEEDEQDPNGYAQLYVKNKYCPQRCFEFE